MTKTDVSKYLQALSCEPLSVLVLAPDLHEGSRIELPYSGTGGELDTEIEKIRKENTPSKLFSADSYFGAVLKKQFVPEEKAVVKRLVVDTCWGITKQINYKFGELKKAVEKTYHKFGLLIVAVPSVEEIEKIKTAVGTLLDSDDTKRLLVCIMRYPLPEETFKNWYELVANGSLAQKSGNTVNANSYQQQATDLVGDWVSTAIGKDMDLLYGTTPSHVYTNKAVISSYEKIVFKIFPAAPEGIIKKITLYKSVALAPAYYGVSRTTLETKNPANDRQKNFNQQWQDCVDILRDNDENVWDCTNIEDIMAMEETKVGRSMAALCSFLNKALTSGIVLLTDLWDNLQQELGYYDTGVCCYLIGFALHFYIGKFTWFDGNNAHKLDEDTISTLVVRMLSGKAAGMKLSSESDIEKRFKDITRRIFGLSQEEVGDIYDCRKNVKIHITKNGYPVWALKYLDDGEFSGIKSEISEIVDKYVEYILESGNQSDVMEKIIGLIKVNPKIYVQMLNALLKDKTKLVTGMKNFIYEKAPDTKAACDKYGFTMETLFTMLSRVLEEEKWQWQEQEVTEAASKLTLDLTLVGVVNDVLEGSAESVEKVRETLSNYLDYIRIPGCVYSSMTDSWAGTVATLHDLSANKWVSYDNDEKIAVIKELEQHMAEAIDNIAHPLSVLKAYIERNGMGMFSETEYNDILQALPKEPLEQTEHNFKSNIKNKIKDLAYYKKVNHLMKTWKARTGADNVSSWTSKYTMPIVWVMPNCGSLFSVISALEENERIDDIRLENAITSIDGTDFSILSDQTEIDRRFIMNVASEKFISILLPHVKALKDKIQNSGFRNYVHWNNDLVTIRPIVEKYISIDLRAEVSDKAKKRVKDINNIDQLKKQLERILDQSSEACLLLLDEE